MSLDIIQNVTYPYINDIAKIEKETYNNPWTKQHIKNDVNHSYGVNYIYIQDKELIAYLFGYLIDDEYYLNKITVKEVYRQKNIGKYLFLYCMKKLKDKHVKCIHLEVSSLNLIAQKFYKNLNFIYSGVRKNYYSKNEDAFLYTYSK